MPDDSPTPPPDTSVEGVASADDPPDQQQTGRIRQERDEHVRRQGGATRFAPGERTEGPPREDGGKPETTGPRTFTVVRRSDESGVSGTGRVLDGCVFHNGQVVICWRGDINSETSGYSSLAIYPCWEAFHKIHIGAHPENRTEVVFGHSADLMARIVDQAAEREPEAGGRNAPEE
jgi:hypothetical protein